jgi:Spy/CpxP family protein refolding chaperone
MKVRDRKDGLNEALAFFETCLETPVVPGELPQWCESATTACSELKAQLAQETGQTHPKMFTQIREEDPALASRIDAMRQTDEKLHEQAEQVETYLHHLCQLSGEVEPDEAKVEEQVEKAAKKGLSLVIEIRKQETAITTWYMEALERDRGVVD